jgi:hypothetical protein
MGKFKMIKDRPLDTWDDIDDVMAVTPGVNCLIVDVAKARPAVVAADLILGRDKHARGYIETHRQRQRPGEREE